MKRTGFRKYSFTEAKERLKAKREGKKPQSRFGRARKPLSRGKRLSARPDRKLAAWSRAVKKRDGNRCQWPARCQTGDTRIDAHHIAERSLRPDLRLDTSNGIALCRTHHDWIPLNRDAAIALGLLSDETYEAARKRAA